MDERGFLRTQGTWIADQLGNVLVLRGVQFDGYQSGHWDWHGMKDYERIASWGFNVVRLPVAWDFIEPQPGKYDNSYFSKYVDRDVAWAKKYGLYIVLTMFQYGWSSHFKYYDQHVSCGVPSWSVSGYPDTADGEARAKADFYNGLGPNGTPPSSTNPSMRDRFMAMWKYVASRYAGKTTIAAYDLLNEPTVFSSDHKVSIYDPGSFYSETEVAFLTGALDAIRTVDGNHMIIWEPTMEQRPPTSRVDRPNVVYSPHYPGSTGSASASHLSFYHYDGNKIWLEDFLEKKVIAVSQQWNQPVFIGEWGICVEATNATQFIRDFLDLMDKYYLGGTCFGYGKAPWGMYLLDKSGNMRTALVENLVRPYVGVSSAPFSSSFDTDEKKLIISAKGGTILGVYLPSSYSSYTLTNDIGEASWTVDGTILKVSVFTELSQVVLKFS
jgi:endoglycosylceramidase